MCRQLREIRGQLRDKRVTADKDETRCAVAPSARYQTCRPRPATSNEAAFTLRTRHEAARPTCTAREHPLRVADADAEHQLVAIADQGVPQLGGDVRGRGGRTQPLPRGCRQHECEASSKIINVRVCVLEARDRGVLKWSAEVDKVPRSSFDGVLHTVGFLYKARKFIKLALRYVHPLPWRQKRMLRDNAEILHQGPL